ncbi:MAG: PEP-CTERM sorting domain-containing protein [Bythopirellula sp.]|nr:PEP-CTERM sorting domain-containing protein [Bythopirellula sp.]
MKRLILLIVVFAMSASVSQAMELLSNGGLNATVQVGPSALYYPEFVDWTITTDPCSYSPCPILPYVPGGVYTPYAGYPAQFADRLNPNAGDHGLIGTSFEGHYPFEITGPVDIEISQEVAGVVGKTYTFSGWAHFEGGYSGGVDFLDLLSPNQRNQDAQAVNPGVPVASLTETIFALEFLDGMGAVLPGSIEIELHDDAGQQNDNQFDGRTWIQHTLSAVAPAGTVSVLVRAGMVDGEFNIDAPNQSVFMDDFSLTCVPEPGSIVMGLMGLAFLGAGRRSR